MPSKEGVARSKRQRRGKGRTRIVRGDRVRVVRGNYRDMEGAVMRIDPEAGRVVVEGVNVRKRHQSPTQENPDGGIVSFEAPIDVSNVMLIDPDSGDPTRVRIRIDKDGTKERIAIRSGNPIPRPVS